MNCTCNLIAYFQVTRTTNVSTLKAKQKKMLTPKKAKQREVSAPSLSTTLAVLMNVAAPLTEKSPHNLQHKAAAVVVLQWW